MRDRSTEEQIWEQVIDRTGRDKFNTVYKIVFKFVSSLLTINLHALLSLLSFFD